VSERAVWDSRFLMQLVQGLDLPHVYQSRRYGSRKVVPACYGGHSQIDSFRCFQSSKPNNWTLSRKDSLLDVAERPVVGVRDRRSVQQKNDMLDQSVSLLRDKVSVEVSCLQYMFISVKQQSIRVLRTHLGPSPRPPTFFKCGQLMTGS
jgi:hypothetical protein